MKAAPNRAEHYAAALFDLAQTTDGATRTRLEQELPAVVDWLRDNEDVRRFLADSTVTPEGKAKALGELLAARVHPICRQFVQILALQGDLDGLPDICNGFLRRVAGSEDVVWGRLDSARPLDDGQVASLEREIGSYLGRSVRLRVTVDPELIGGVTARVGNHVLDGSVSGRLETLRAALLV